MNRNIRLLFDNLKDGLLIVSPAGVVQFANVTARALVQIAIGKPLAGEWLRSQLMAIERGYLNPPLTFDIAVPGQTDAADCMQVTILPSPVGRDFVVLMKNLTAEQCYENVIGNLAEMLDCEISQPMQQFLNAATKMVGQLKEASGTNTAIFEQVAEVDRRAGLLVRRLKQIGVLASVFKTSPIRGDDRIVVSDLIIEAVATLKAQILERQIGLSYAGLLNGLPVIYGSRIFLVHALAGYLRYLVKQSDPGANILISARAKGNFMLLGITSFGQCAIPGGNSRPFMPLLDNISAGGEEGLNLTLPLCKRVVELNGGHLRLEREGESVNRIVFELPIGAPAVNDRDLGLKQAERYAEDLLTMMKRGDISPRASK